MLKITGVMDRLGCDVVEKFDNGDLPLLALNTQ